MADNEGMGTRRNISFIADAKTQIFSFSDGRKLIVREKDGKMEVQRFNRHGAPETPSLKL